MGDNSLDDIYRRIYVEIKNQNSLDSLKRLYDHIFVIITNTNSDTILKELYRNIIVKINGVSATRVVNATGGPGNNSQNTPDQLNDLYENRIIVDINDVNTNENENENENGILDIDYENDRFYKMLKDNFKSKLIKYIYLTFMANDIYIEINHNNAAIEKHTLELIKDCLMLQEEDLNNDENNDENKELFDHVKNYTSVAIDKIQSKKKEQ